VLTRIAAETPKKKPHKIKEMHSCCLELINFLLRTRFS